MEFALTQEVSEMIIKKGISDIITKLSNDLAIYFRDKYYGEGLKGIYIGIICVAPEFEFFFKERKPKYKRGKQVIIQDEREYEFSDILTYDIKLDHKKLLEATEVEIKGILTTSLVQSLEVFESVKIKLFERDRFEAEIGSYPQNYPLSR